MIFVTTGTQLPFVRLIDEMNRLAPALNEKIVAQTGPGPAPWENLDLHARLDPAQFSRFFNEARVVVAHAGIGTILSAKAAGKPLILLPRRHDMGEHRNDHQLATARKVESLTGVYIAWDTSEIEPLLRRDDLVPATPEPGPRSAALLARIRDFIDGPAG